MVAALLGVAAVWRAVSGVAALVRWLWIGSVLGNRAMSLLLVSVVVGPVIGAVGAEAALRRGLWSRSDGAHHRRLAAVVGLLGLPFVATRLVGRLIGGRPASLPLHGVVTLLVTMAVLLATFGGCSGDDE